MNYVTAMIKLPIVKEEAFGERISKPDDVSRLCDDLRCLAQETFQVLSLNAKNRLINRHMVSLGIINASLVHAREVMRTAIMENAHSIILVHNHPSGDPQPSAEDIKVTKRLIEAGRILDIRLVDHIIVGRYDADNGIHCDYLSMRESAFCKFD